MKPILLLFIIAFTFANRLAAQQDSSMVTFDSFLQLVLKNHPLSSQATLLLASGDQTVKSARGFFDPNLKSAFDQKQYEGIEYYRINNNELKLPTLLGLELKAGYDNTTGKFINPEERLPANGLAYAGVILPLGNGLFFDERRQALRQAEVFQKATVIERTLMLNQLFYDASKAYWDWYVAWNTYRIFSESVELADFRFQGVRQNFIFGDEPAIDTLEAYILVQNRELSRDEAYIELQNTYRLISNFLWAEDGTPLVLSDKAIPEKDDDGLKTKTASLQFIDEAIASLDSLNPELLLYRNKIDYLTVERRMKAEKIKPKLNLNYNLLNEPVGGNPFENYSLNDYKWGFEFGMPLLLRKERADLQLTKLKIERANLDLAQKRVEVSNKLQAYRSEINTLTQQIELYSGAVKNYDALLRGEKRKFEEGESSLFLVNTRENSFITAETKLIELHGKYNKAWAALLMTIGTAADGIEL